MLHSVYFFSTRGDSHILHHACLFFSARECVLHRNTQGAADTPKSKSIQEAMALQGNALLRTPIVALLRHGSHSSGSSPGGSLGAVAHKWAILAPTWLSWFQLRSNLGSMLGQLGPNFAQLGQSWRQLGASWAQLGTSLIPTWPILASTSPNLTWEPVPRARWWHGQQALDKHIQKMYEFTGHRYPGLVGLVVL